MEENSRKRSSGGLRRGPSLVLRDSAENTRDRNAQVCSRVGCSSKLHSMKDAQTGSPSKVKTPKTPFRSSALGKESIGSSSKTLASPTTPRKSFSDMKKKLPSHLDTDSETSSLPDESEKVYGKSRMRVYPAPEDHYPVEARSSDVGSSSAGPSNRIAKKNIQRFVGLGRQDSTASSSASAALKQVNQGVRNGGTSANKCNLRQLKCNSISDVVPSSSSSSPSPDSSLNRKDSSGRKRIGEAESSVSVRGKKINGTTKDDRRNDFSNRGISISDSRHNRSSSPRNDETASNRTRRLSRTRLSSQESRDVLPLVESPLMDPSSPHPDLSADAIDFSLENQFSGQIPASPLSSFSRPGSGSGHVRSNRPMGSYEAGISRSFMNRDSLRQYNLDGIAEMLLALERIEQEEEPTYEQLLALETNLFLGGLGFHDQHRDLRLDIDDMSYEELLALEERMGTVSTGVPDDVLGRCLNRSIYQGIAESREDENDIKCSICQEEYVIGEETGRLSCDHRYHHECIDQWLRLKNWCPICKTSVASSPSASLLP